MTEPLPMIEVPPGVTVEQATKLLRKVSVDHFHALYKHAFFAARERCAVMGNASPAPSQPDTRAALVSDFRRLMELSEVAIAAEAELTRVEQLVGDRPVSMGAAA